jgi:hypothetical protein
MKKLNLGCGKDIKDGYVNLDSVKLPGIDIVHNLDKYPWPFKNNEFDEIEGYMILEHLDSIIKPLEEIWRISKNKAIIKIKVPLFPSIYSVSDPTHKQFFTYFTFNYFTENDNLNYYSKARFNILQRGFRFSWNKFLNFPSIFMNRFPKLYSRYLSSILPCNELYVELEVVK